MNEKKICFIMCINDQRYFEEALYYLKRLHVPEGYKVDLITITEAKSMAGGYNEAMLASDAKYKVYLHQDVFIVEREFISKLLEVFSDSQVGLVGLVGCVELPENAIQWMGKRTGALISNNIHKTSYARIADKQSDVVSVDGLLMATQYDISWREDLFTGWDFYDLSQSFEFRRAGYRVVVPFQEKPWVIHYDGYLNLKNYWHYRRVFIETYKDEMCELTEFASDSIQDVRSENFALDQSSKEERWQHENAESYLVLMERINNCIAENDFDELSDIMSNEAYYQKFHDKTGYSFARLIYVVAVMEKEAENDDTILNKGNSLDEIVSTIINPIRFFLWRIEFGQDEDAKSVLFSLVKNMGLSSCLLSLMIDTTSTDRDVLLK